MTATEIIITSAFIAAFTGTSLTAINWLVRNHRRNSHLLHNRIFPILKWPHYLALVFAVMNLLGLIPISLDPTNVPQVSLLSAVDAVLKITQLAWFIVFYITGLILPAALYLHCYSNHNAWRNRYKFRRMLHRQIKNNPTTEK